MVCPGIPTCPAMYPQQGGQQREDEWGGRCVQGGGWEGQHCAQCHKDVNTEAGPWHRGPLITVPTVAALFNNLLQDRPLPAHVLHPAESLT